MNPPPAGPSPPPVRRLDGRDPAHLRLSWAADAPPVFSVDSDEVFEVEVHDSSTGQLGPGSDRAALATLDARRLDAIAGPIEVRGARLGDALDVEILDVRPASWGWSAVFREFGFLRGRFDDDLVIWAVGGSSVHPVRGFLRQVELPTAPMIGVLGVAPASGSLPLIPPDRFGGNMDHRAHRAGSTVRLPVFRPGGQLSVGDPHALQGDGEVCGTGVEVPAKLRLRASVVPGAAPPFPRVIQSVPVAPAPGPAWTALGVADTLEGAARGALENLLAWLVAEGWSEKEAYLLASLVGQMRIAEVVDAPNFVVAVDFPAGLGFP